MSGVPASDSPQLQANLHSSFVRHSNKRKKKPRGVSECVPSAADTSTQSAFNHASAESSVDDFSRRSSHKVRQYMSASDEDLHKSEFMSTVGRSSLRSSRGRRRMNDLGSINVRLSAMDLSTGLPFFDGKTGIAVESDSYTEAFNAPLKPYRKKKFIKRMAIDPCPPVGKHYFDTSDLPMGMDVDSSAQLHINCGMNLTSAGEGNSADFLHQEGQCTCPMVCAERLDSGFGLTSENAVEFDTLSETSVSSGESAGLFTNDEGREGDDEQSDWFLDESVGLPTKTPSDAATSAVRTSSPENVCMGIPIPPKLVKRVSSPLFRSDSPLNKLNLSGPDSGSCSTQQPQTPSVPESSDTDMSQGSWCYRRPCDASSAARMALRRSNAKGSKAAFVHAMSKKINRFLDDKLETELTFGPLKKREQTEILKLATFYQLDVRYKSKRRRHGLVLVKTKFCGKAAGRLR